MNYANETASLNPPHKFLPWVLVNNDPLCNDPTDRFELWHLIASSRVRHRMCEGFSVDADLRIEVRNRRCGIGTAPADPQMRQCTANAVLARQVDSADAEKMTAEAVPQEWWWGRRCKNPWAECVPSHVRRNFRRCGFEERGQKPHMRNRNRTCGPADAVLAHQVDSADAEKMTTEAVPQEQ
uniref:Uncharacterized protein LOC104249988 n=1 Tax=Nicotiana sylvestris TaxID=4096 RepID=A0A1U7YL80_NICSY|nr:PREDICTED: uncharacterized protein LOC104249988 [Nicotiana sylvestris]